MLRRNWKSRYLAGECKQVWCELIRDSHNQFSEKNQEEINEILDFTMQRVKHNIQNLESKLRELGYIFTNNHFNPRNFEQEPIYLPPQKGNQLLIQQLITSCKPYYLPATFLKFLEIVGTVNFIGYFKDWREKTSFPLLDALQVFPLELILKYPEYFYRWRKKGNFENFIEFCSDKLLKENISGGMGLGIKLYTYPTIDAKVINYDDDESDILFLDYLRLAFRWGGFPNLDWYEIEDEVKTRIDFLTKDLLQF
jgi:hypothetical protein